MKKAKYVEVCDGHHHFLEKMEEKRFKMREVEGEIISCESRRFPVGSISLVMRLKNFRKEVSWNYESKMPLLALVGQTLRGFYEKENRGTVSIEAYELLNGDKVLRRGKMSIYHKFIETD